MKFHVKKIILWLKNKDKRELVFEPNKINIITGGSNTGKTAILDILDYCLFASHHKISESIINESVEWYGLTFQINDKTYNISRKSPLGNLVSQDYYFSSIGEEPETLPEANNSEGSIKKTLEAEFGINRDLKIPFGGKQLKAGSKISLRYFLLFCTISQDIITHSEQFFDKQNISKYKEALDRIFDLAVGIDDLENILKAEKRQEIEQELKRFNNKEEKFTRGKIAFHEELTSLLRRAKEYSLISIETKTEDAITQLRNITIQTNVPDINSAHEKYDRLTSEVQIIKRKIKNLERFQDEYKTYKTNLDEVQESLLPIKFINDNYNDLIKTSIYYEIISSLNTDYENIKKSIKNKTPLDGNISDLLKDYKNKYESLQKEIEHIPEMVKSFENNKDKYEFLGEIKAKLDLYSEPENNKILQSSKVDSLINDIENLKIRDIGQNRLMFIRMLDEIIQGYIETAKDALENYGKYRAAFNYKDKKLELRPPEMDRVENVGSSSNHMFLHLFLFLGLHEAMLKKNSPHVPSFLIIDQFSRPYWGEADHRKQEIDNSDIQKVKTALKLLNNFIKKREERNEDFQMIIFEHIESPLWAEFNNVHLVENFRNGNALIQSHV